MKYYGMAAEEADSIDAFRLAHTTIDGRTNHLRRVQRAMKRSA